MPQVDLPFAWRIISYLLLRDKHLKNEYMPAFFMILSSKVLQRVRSRYYIIDAK